MKKRQGFPNLIRYYRKLAGVSQEALAKSAGLSRHTLVAWEEGRSTPSPEQAKHLTKVLKRLMSGMHIGLYDPISADGEPLSSNNQ